MGANLIRFAPEDDAFFPPPLPITPLASTTFCLASGIRVGVVLLLEIIPRRVELRLQDVPHNMPDVHIFVQSPEESRAPWDFFT
jgi:hypothetical protein